MLAFQHLSFSAFQLFAAVQFDGTINLGNIITVVVLVCGLFAQWVKLQSRLSSVEEEQRNASDERKDISVQLRNLTVQSAKLEERVKTLNDQLNRLPPRK